MIKICALDLLNKEAFTTDIMTADGRVLFRAGEKIRPEMILRLYFREIYVTEAPAVQEVQVKTTELEAAVDKSQAEKAVAVGVNALDSQVSEKENVPRYTDSRLNEVAMGNPRAADLNDEKIYTVDPTMSTPSPAAPNIEEDVEVVDVGKGPSLAPKDIDISVSEISSPEIHFAQNNALDMNEKASVQNMSSASPQEEIKKEIVDENPPLVFSEDQAKRIADVSVRIGKLLNYSGSELKELEQIAYYYNIGITKFRKADLRKNNFRKLKALAGYQQLIEENKLTEKLADIIKFSTNAYESDSFPLNSKIPYNHIISITGFYEDMLAQGQSKNTVLLKMLEMGGNHFNIFVLHKFLKIMRDTNE